VATGRGAADQISLFAQNAESLEALYGLVEARIPSDDTERSAADLAFSRLVENELLLEELFGGIELAIGRSLRIIKEILAFGQLGQQRVTTTAFDVAALLHEVVREIVLPTDHIELALPALGTASLRSAPVHLRHLLENVVRNSVDALRGVSGRPRRLTLGVQPVADGIDIEVVDTGIGMSEATQRRAFEPFFSTKLPTGTGLGLSVVRRLAFLLGGSVTLESTHREGTRVVVHVPNQPEA
jgi:two-component system NtrC family sensor kinase